MDEERYDDEFMSFTVKVRVSDANLGVFQDCKEYALINSDDNYVLAIRNLLEKVELYEIFREEYRNGRREQIKDSD